MSISVGAVQVTIARQPESEEATDTFEGQFIKYGESVSSTVTAATQKSVLDNESVAVNVTEVPPRAGL